METAKGAVEFRQHHDSAGERPLLPEIRRLRTEANTPPAEACMASDDCMHALASSTSPGVPSWCERHRVQLIKLRSLQDSLVIAIES